MGRSEKQSHPDAREAPMDEAKLPKRVLKIVEICKSGQTLHHCNVVKATGNVEHSYWFEPSGKPAGPKSARQAIEAGLLEPFGDSLFDALDSQSFRAAP